MALAIVLMLAGVTARMLAASAAPDANWSGTANLLPLIHPEQDAVKGVWKLSDGALVSDKSWASLQIPFRPPEEYDLRVTFARLEGHRHVVLIFPEPGRGFTWQLGRLNNSAFAFMSVTSAGMTNPTVVAVKPALENNRHYTTLIEVRKDGVKAYLDGKLISAWKTDYHDMSVETPWLLRDPQLPGVGSCESPTAFYSIELREITGRRKPPPRFTLKPGVIANGAEWRDGKPMFLPGARRPKVETVVIGRPEPGWTFSHHAHIAWYNGRLVAIWSNGHKDEDGLGQRVLFATSTNFTHWTRPQPLVDSARDARGVEQVLTAAGLYTSARGLVAYIASYGPRQANPRVFALRTGDGSRWEPLRDLGLPLCPNHGPQRTASGRLIISGNMTYPWSDDPSGLGGWHMAGLYPPAVAAKLKTDPASFRDSPRRAGLTEGVCEGAFYQTDDGVIHMLLRNGDNKQFPHRLWHTESRNNGLTWSAPIPTEFSDTSAKFHFGRLPDGRFYYVGNPLAVGHRMPLVLSLSRDGMLFDQHYIIGEKHYERLYPGRAKGGEYGYPHSMVHDGYLYVIVSRQKEVVEVLRVASSTL